MPVHAVHIRAQAVEAFVVTAALHLRVGCPHFIHLQHVGSYLGHHECTKKQQDSGG